MKFISAEPYRRSLKKSENKSIKWTRIKNKTYLLPSESGILFLKKTIGKNSKNKRRYIAGPKGPKSPVGIGTWGVINTTSNSKNL